MNGSFQRVRRWMLPLLAVGLGVGAGLANGSVVSAKASGESEVSVQAVPKLAFNLPARSAHKKLVFAHYWSPEPISLDNADPASDYYQAHYLQPEGEDGKHFAYGGLQRDRPVPRRPSAAKASVALSYPSPQAVSGDAIAQASLTVPQWQIDDMRTEVQQAQGVGIDGFAVNLFNLTDLSKDNGPRQLAMMRAASQVSGFKIMLQPDMSIMDMQVKDRPCGSYASQYANRVDQAVVCLPTPRRMAEDLRALITAGGGSIYRSGGRVVISPYINDREKVASVGYWKAVAAALKAPKADPKTRVVPPAYTMTLLPLFVNPSKALFDAYKPISMGVSWWGSRSPAAIATAPSYAKEANKRGLKWMAPVAAQDARPKSQMYSEANNTGALRASWERATTGKVGKWAASKPVADRAADMVLLPTWNDYTEATSFAPSQDHGWSLLDINAYYMSKFQTGSSPKIVRDTIYVSHRVQFTGAKPARAGQSYVKKLGGDAGKVVTYNAFQSYQAGHPYGKKPYEGPVMNAAGYASSNRVEVLTMLTKKSKVRVVIGSKTYDYTAPAGVSVKYFALRAGRVVAQLRATVNGKSVVTATAATGDLVGVQPTEDLAYHFAGSRR